MIEFSDQITINLHKKDQQTEDKSLENLDRLCQCLLRSLLDINDKDKQLQIRFSLCIGIGELQIPFNRQDCDSRNKVEELQTKGLKYCFLFLEYIEQLYSITFSFMTLNSYMPDNSVGGLIIYNNTTICNHILFQTKQSVQKLEFTRCNLIGNFTSHYPKIYRSIEYLQYQSSNLLDTGEYGKYQNLKELRIVNCGVYRIPKIDEDQRICKKVCDGVNIEMLQKLLGSEEALGNNRILKTLAADLHVGEDLRPDNNHPWNLITTIEHCKLRDFQTSFSFSMIQTLLCSSNASDSNLPPISLEIWKFKDMVPIKFKGQPVENALKNITDAMGLSIYGYEKVFASAGLIIIVLYIKLKENEGRRLKLKFMGGLQVY